MGETKLFFFFFFLNQKEGAHVTHKVRRREIKARRALPPVNSRRSCFLPREGRREGGGDGLAARRGARGGRGAGTRLGRRSPSAARVEARAQTRPPAAGRRREERGQRQREVGRGKGLYRVGPQPGAGPCIEQGSVLCCCATAAGLCSLNGPRGARRGGDIGELHLPPCASPSPSPSGEASKKVPHAPAPCVAALDTACLRVVAHHLLITLQLNGH